MPDRVAGEKHPQSASMPDEAKHAWIARVRRGRHIARTALPAFAAHIESADPDDPRASLLVAPREGAHAALITFGGNAGYLMLHQSMRDLPDMHLIAIRDPRRCFSMCGVDGLGDTYEACLDSLRKLLRALGVTSVYCAGVSAGGYPALRYGLSLKAQGVLAMSAPTTLDLKSDPGTTLADYPFLTALYRTRREMGQDLVPLYQTTLPRPRALLLYAPSNSRDAWLSRRMGGIPGVELEELDEKAGHRVVQWLDSTGGLATYVNRLRALTHMRPAISPNERRRPPIAATARPIAAGWASRADAMPRDRGAPIGIAPGAIGAD